MVNKIEQAYEIIQREGLTTTSCIEQLSWLIFLKAFENLERKRKHEAELEGEQYEPTIEPKYSWSSWAKKDIDAYELKSFIENELLPYLKNLHDSKERKIIATAFSEAKQNMKNAINLKEVVLTLNDIDFMKLENLSMLSQFYEELLVKVGSESGSVGEYYTPRPIIRLMVKIVHPKINLVFFDNNGPTKEIWYYELTPEKSYSKANPLRDEDLVDCFEKWKNKETSENSWIVPVEDIIKRDYDLTAKNPNKKQEVVRIAPEKLVEGLIVKERQILEILEGLRKLLSEKSKAKQDKFNDSTKEEAQGFYDLPKKWTWAKLGELISIEAGKRPVGGSSKEGIPSLGGEQLLPSGEINWEKLRYIPEDFYDSMKRGKVKLGDVLIVKDGATTGKTAYVKYLPFEKVAVNEHIFILRSRDENKLLNEYLFFVLLSELGQRQIKKFFHGTAQGGITRSNVEEVLIPLPTV
ncbi:MAG: N-6 DNA methylase, partial [Thermoproteota archaeon]